MALTIHNSSSDVMSLGDFLSYVESNVDLLDLDSVAAAAPNFRRLANDRSLVLNYLNRQVKENFRSQVIPSAQAMFLGDGRDFYVRANIWPSNADIASGRVYQDTFSYNIGHDHNYNFMTVGYHGPGYVTDLYEYDVDKVIGRPGEAVDLTFVETTHFTKGMVMLYYAGKDVHTQYPPEDLSLTLNFMVATPEVRLRDQFFFDLEKRTLLDYPSELDSSRRVSLLKIAGHIGDANTQDLLDEIGLNHPCRRTRIAACNSLTQLDPASAERVWDRAARDPEQLVVDAAKQHLAELAR